MFNRHNFEIAKLAPAEDDRFAMCSLCIRPDATLVTDGHLAVIVTAPQAQTMLFPPTDGIEVAEHFTQFLMDRETALKVAKSIPKKGEPSAQLVAVDVSTEVNDSSTVAVNENVRQGIVRSRKMSGAFPNFEAIIPAKDVARFTITFDPELLSSLLQVIQGFCKGNGTRNVTLRLYGPSHGMRLDAEGPDQKLTAIIMPTRIIEEKQDTPDAG